MARETKNSKIRAILFVCASLFLFSFARGASAASLYLAPASGSYFVGQSFTVNVDVSSPGQAMNAAQGTLHFPIGSLQVISLSTANSIVNLWVQQPSFSNQDGVVNFGGVVVNPGFEGAAGKILTITFRARATGSAPITFTSGSLLANDGKGTNILSGMTGANMTINPAPAGTSGNAVSSPTTQSAPTAIFSTPSVSANKWYNLNSILFNWVLPSDVDGVDYAIATTSDYSLPNTTLGIVASTSYDLSQFEDGNVYFFLSFREDGTWTTPAVKSFALDRTPPVPFTIVRADNNLSDTNPTFTWSTSDIGSGLAYYEAKIGDGDWFDPSTIQRGSSYILPTQSPADSRLLTVRAYDNAGNYQSAAILFTVTTPGGVKMDFRHWIQVISAWEWLLLILALLLIGGVYYFIYNSLMWRRRLRNELTDFRSDIEKDLKHIEAQLGADGREIDLRPSHIGETKRSIEKEVKKLEEDVKKESDRLDRKIGKGKN